MMVINRKVCEIVENLEKNPLSQALTGEILNISELSLSAEKIACQACC